jgi:hypothetical protein
MTDEQVQQIFEYIGGSQERQKRTEDFRDNLVNWMEKCNELFSRHSDEISEINRRCAEKMGFYAQMNQHMLNGKKDKEKKSNNYLKIGLAMVSVLTSLLIFTFNYGALWEKVNYIYKHSYGVQNDQVSKMQK